MSVHSRWGWIVLLGSAACGGSQEAVASRSDALGQSNDAYVAQANINLEQQGDVLTEAAKTTKLIDFLDLVTKADLTTRLRSAGPWTLFAPTDSAFRRLSEDSSLTREQLKDPAEAQAFVLRHIVEGNIPFSLVRQKAEKGETLATLGSAPLHLIVERPEGVVRIESAQIIQGDLATKNGLLHIVDRVLIPPTPEARTPLN